VPCLSISNNIHFNNCFTEQNKLDAEKMWDEEKRMEMDKADAEVKEAMKAMGLDDDVVPTSDEQRQVYLTKQLQLGEQFLSKGMHNSFISFIWFKCNNGI
jgi:hypothetical protein